LIKRKEKFMNDLLLGVALGGCVVAAAAFAALHFATQQIDRLTAQNKDLFNRLMSKGFGDYASGTATISPPAYQADVAKYMQLNKQHETETDDKEQEMVTGYSVV
jgi:hypothetical protein